MDKLITTSKAAELLGRSVATLNRWRSMNKRNLPSSNKKDLPYIKVGRGVMYSVDDIEKWIEKQRVE